MATPKRTDIVGDTIKIAADMAFRQVKLFEDMLPPTRTQPQSDITVEQIERLLKGA